MKKKHIVITITITITTLIILLLLSIPTIFIFRAIELNEIGSEAESVSDILNLDTKQTETTAKITFTELDGTTSLHLEMKDYTKLKVSSTLDHGQIRVKLTQGDLWTTEVMEEIIPSNSDGILIPLDIWDKNELLGIWIIGDEANEGTVDIELIK